MTKFVAENSATVAPLDDAAGGMKRAINWVDAFWISSGASTIVLLSIGSIAATIGTPSWLVWLVSTVIGFVQLFIYAEMSGMFPNHSGGASVYGAIAWRKYGKILAPICVWCNWLGWTPVLALGASLVGSYVVSTFFPADSSFATFSMTLLDLSAILPGITFKITSPILIGAVTLLISFYLQHSGILRMARTQFLLAILSLIPIMLLSFVPLLTGKVSFAHFVPFNLEGMSSWTSPEALTLLAGGLFIAAWTTYAGETAMCYVSEFKRPEKDTIRAVTSVGLLSAVAFGVLPFTFLGVLGMETLKDPAFVAGDPQSAIVRMAQIAFGNGLGIWLTIMLIMAVVLAIITSMAGTSRTLYQASVEGWLPKYLSHLNEKGVPTKAMWTDLIVNLFLLALGSPIFVLAASCTGFVIGTVMNLLAAWMHRRDRPNHPRPYRAPDWLINFGAPILALTNLIFIIFGANTFAPGALWYGLGAILLVIPMFWYRHHYVDQGVWPAAAQTDLGMEQPLP
jgi:amino acid transporter